MVDPLRSLLVVAGFGPEDIGYEGLRIAVIEREPAGLDLHHDAVAGQEDVIRIWQRELVRQRLVGLDGAGGFEALAIADAEDVGGVHQLISSQCRLACDFVGIDIDQLYYPI